MAEITEVRVEPAEIEAGGTAQVEIVVSGLAEPVPAQRVKFNGRATLDTGQVLEGPGVVNIRAKPGETVVSYELVDVDGAGVTIEQDADQPNVFRVTVP